jgi:primosomal protein N' (replication factor Y) (superfamily II helicase)
MQVEVVPEIKTDKQSFSYRAAKNISDQLSVGSIVSVEFGKRKIRGVVCRLSKEIVEQKYSLKSIINVDKKFRLPLSYLEIARWISEYYLCSWGEAVSLFLPPPLSRPRKRMETKKLPENKLSTLNKLTPNQQAVFKDLLKDLNSEEKKPGLIFGVTGSGKTEIYLSLAKETINGGKSVVLLVPEIVLTPQNIHRFQDIFGQEVCIMHSKLSRSERFYCYLDFFRNKKKIIIGPRSALLVPNENIGLIIIDEEQEDSYKQEQRPRYDALSLAEKIAKKNKALLVLGSATPRVETFHKAKSGIWRLFNIDSRYNQPVLPVGEIVDMKNEIKSGNFSLISEKLFLETKKALGDRKQVILFLNRRGMSTFVSCRDCGEVINCKFCQVPMVYHLDQSADYLSCHHCQYKEKTPRRCPKCQSARIKYFGSGIEKIDQEIRGLFPKARIKRVDSRVLKNSQEYFKFYDDFNSHRFDIVIGTQVLAKGFDIANVALVGIISADVGLHLPYFRASEKIFRLVTQVSGRSGRRGRIGRTVIQTYWPDSTAIKYASRHDYLGFYQLEIKKRLEKNYPPSGHIIRILAEDKDQSKAQKRIKNLAVDLLKNDLNFIGPGECFFRCLRNKWRYQLIIKTKNWPEEKILKIEKLYPDLLWDVDAINLL